MGRSRGVLCVVAFGLVVLCVSVQPGFARECPKFAGLIPGNVSVVEVSGDYAYLGNGSELVIADVTNPAVPSVIAGLQMPDSGSWWTEAIVAVAVADGYSLVASSNTDHPLGSVHLVDVRTPSHPVIVRSLQVDGPIHDLAINDGYAYIVAGGGFLSGTRIPGSLRVFDVGHPPDFPQVAFLEAIWWAPASVAAASGYAYLADSTSGLRVFDMSNPSTPIEVGHHGMHGTAKAVTVANDYAFVVASGGGHGDLCVMDVSTPTAPVEVGALETSGDILGVEVSGNYAYLAQGESGVRVVDVGVPSSPVEVGAIDTPGDAVGVVISGEIAFVADGRQGLRLLDVNEPSSPVGLGFIDAVVARNVAAANGFAYVRNSDGLTVLDVTDRSAPVKIGSLSMEDVWTTDIAVSGNLVYTTGSGFQVIDVREPSSPVEVGFLDAWGWLVGVSGHSVYLADSDGLRVIDTSVPSAPVEVGFLPDLSPCWGDPGAVSGRYGFVLGWSSLGSGLHILDLGDPSAPTVEGFIDIPLSDMGAVAASGGYAYVPSNRCGYPPGGSCRGVLHLIDVSIPSEPEESWFLEFDEEITSVAAYKDHVFVAGESGLHVINVSDPSIPVEEQLIPIPFVPLSDPYWSGLVVSGVTLFAPAGDQGMTLFDLRGCSGPYERPPIAAPQIE